MASRYRMHGMLIAYHMLTKRIEIIIKKCLITVIKTNKRKSAFIRQFQIRAVY